MRRDTLTLQARYVFPVEGPPIEDGVVTLQQGRIGWVGSSRERAGDLDLGNVAIVPGLRQRPHASRAGEPRRRERARDRGSRRTRWPGSAGWSTSGGAARSRSLRRGGRAEPHRLHRGRHDAAWPTRRPPG